VRHRPSPAPEFVVISVADQFQLDSSGCMAGLQLDESSCKLLYACHLNRSLGPWLALQYVAAGVAADIGLSLHHGC